MPETMTFQGKVVLITGAASGIGATTAEWFAELGASLALIDMNMSGLEDVAAKCKKLNNIDPFLFCADLTKDADVQNIVPAVLSHFKQLNVLVNNAGIYKFGTIENTSMAQYDKTFDINVRAVFQLTMLAVPHLIAAKGCVVNVSSLAGLRSYSELLAYCMSKAALDQFTRCVALELAPKGVRVNSVNPGVILPDLPEGVNSITDLIEMMKVEMITAEDMGTEADMMGKWNAMHPMGRPGSNKEVAKCISFLASDDASFVNGITFPIDGGKQAAGAY